MAEFTHYVKDRRQADLNTLMEFDHVIRVIHIGDSEQPEVIVIDAGGYSPELYMDLDSDGQLLPGSDAELNRQANSAGWDLMRGYTGQYGYDGPVMHASEFIGGYLEDAILAQPGLYVVTEPRGLAPDNLPEDVRDEIEQDGIGWVVCRRLDDL